MPVLIREVTPNEQRTICAGIHSHCVVCGVENPQGMHLQFCRDHNGGIVGRFQCDPKYAGYPQILHGGIVASLLDGAMTNLLFADGVRAMTAELVVRFRRPVRVSDPAIVSATRRKSHPPLYVLKARLEQGGCVCATAVGKFLQNCGATGQ